MATRPISLIRLAAFFLPAALASCTTVTVSKLPFGTTKEGARADLYTLKNDKGMEVKITNYGGIVTEIHVPDRGGKFADVALGYDTLSSYIKASPYFGCITGRYANRIAKGRFTLDGTEYALATNNGPNHLHGGDVGFDKRLWTAREVSGLGKAGIELTYTSPDGEEGYPGNLDCKVTYLLTGNNELRIDYEATTDKKTHVNLTQHSYFNLAGAGNGDILGHQMQLPGARIVPTDKTNIPTGELMPVAGTPFDFRKPHAIGERIKARHPQITAGHGYDHTWLVPPSPKGLPTAAIVYEPESGRVMEVLTDQPGVQFYSGNFLDGSNVGKGGKTYKHRYGFCLETHLYPDTPNQPTFPSSTLNPGETYRHTCIYRFSTR